MNNYLDIEHDDAAITAKLRDFIDEIRAIDLENKALDRRRRDLYRIAAESGFNGASLKGSLVQVPARRRQRRTYSLNIWQRSAAIRLRHSSRNQDRSQRWRSGPAGFLPISLTPSVTPDVRLCRDGV